MVVADDCSSAVGWRSMTSVLLVVAEEASTADADADATAPVVVPSVVAALGGDAPVEARGDVNEEDIVVSSDDCCKETPIVSESVDMVGSIAAIGYRLLLMEQKMSAVNAFPWVVYVFPKRPHTTVDPRGFQGKTGA